MGADAVRRVRFARPLRAAGSIRFSAWRYGCDAVRVAVGRESASKPGSRFGARARRRRCLFHVKQRACVRACLAACVRHCERGTRAVQRFATFNGDVLSGVSRDVVPRETPTSQMPLRGKPGRITSTVRTGRGTATRRVQTTPGRTYIHTHPHIFMQYYFRTSTTRVTSPSPSRSTS